MKSIAVLLTCFNRREKSLSALKRVYTASKKVTERLDVQIYLTDDGSTDGTADAVRKEFPNVNILPGDGTLFWAGGMRNSWREALKVGYDGYLLLNDDTDVFPNLFDAYLEADSFCRNKYGKGGIYVGSTKDSETDELTYGGAELLSKFSLKYQHIVPNGTYQKCDLGNANILFVTKDVVDAIGILSRGYKHGVADYDYTLRAVKKDIPVLVMPGFLGNCSNDHSDIYEKFTNIGFKERLKIMQSPLGLDFSSNLNLMKRHFPLRVPLVIFSAGLKLLFPKYYLRLSKMR